MLPIDDESMMKSLSNRNSNSRENESQVLTNNLHQLKLEKKTIVDKKLESHHEYKPEKWILSDQEGSLNQLNLAIVSIIFHKFCLKASGAIFLCDYVILVMNLSGWSCGFWKINTLW